MGKPYSFVPFLKTQEYEPDINTLTGKIDVSIKVLNELYISSGNYNMDSKGVLYKEFFKINDKYVIPGTSIKGMIRSFAEMVSYSCFIDGKQNGRSLPTWKEKSKGIHCCIDCDIFGCMGKRSKIRVSDFYHVAGTGKSIIVGMPTLRNPKINDLYYNEGKLIGYKIYKHGIESIIKRGKNNSECFTSGSEFKGSIIYDNVDLKELKLICYALGLSHSFNHKLGYGKPAYYGSIEVNCDDKKYIDYAIEYEKNSELDIKKNIKLLEQEYSFKNARKVADYDVLY